MPAFREKKHCFIGSLLAPAQRDKRENVFGARWIKKNPQAEFVLRDRQGSAVSVVGYGIVPNQTTPTRNPYRDLNPQNLPFSFYTPEHIAGAVVDWSSSLRDVFTIDRDELTRNITGLTEACVICTGEWTSLFEWISKGVPPHVTETPARGFQGELVFRPGATKVVDHLAELLGRLEKLAESEMPFDENLVDAVDDMLEADAENTTRLLEVVTGTATQPDQRGWSPRVRWFAIEALARARDPRLPEVLVQLVESSIDLLNNGSFQRQEQLVYGAVVNLRYIKVPSSLVERAREGLRLLLLSEVNVKNLAGSVFGDQFVGQTLATLGSFGNRDNLGLIMHFALGDYAFVIRFNGLEAATRIVRRTAPADLNEFYSKVNVSLIQTCHAFANNRRLGGREGSLLWATCELILARLGPEIEGILSVMDAFPTLAREIQVLLRRAHLTLVARGQEWWLEENADLLRRLEGFSSTESAPDAG